MLNGDRAQDVRYARDPDGNVGPTLPCRQETQHDCNFASRLTPMSARGDELASVSTAFARSGGNDRVISIASPSLSASPDCQ
jgi:hypothetical protein